MKPLLPALLLTLLCSIPPATAAEAQRLPTPLPVPGGVALVPLESASASLEGRPLLVVSSQGTAYADQGPWLAVVGIDLATPPGPLTLEAGGRKLSIQVQDKQYREQRLTVSNKRHVDPTPRDLERIGRERTEMLAALGNWRDDGAPVTHFALPAPGPFSSPFGLKRFFNDQPRAPHSGLDIAAPKGTPISAPAPGIVTAAGDYFFNGRNLILDHGHGLVTMYSHLDQIAVKVGDRVQTGDRLGSVGNSGRVTGPHLHWTVSLNNVRVDPMLFIDPPR